MAKSDNGYSSYVILIHDRDLGRLGEKVERYNSYYEGTTYLDIIEKYDKEGYWFVQIEAMDYTKTNKELTEFVLNTLPFLAIKEEDSTWIIIQNEKSYKKALEDIYTKNELDNLLYDMLTIGDRYNAILSEMNIDERYVDEIRLIYEVYGNQYSLLFERGCKYLFVEDTNIILMDDVSGLQTEIDILDCIGIFKFNLGILNLKS